MILLLLPLCEEREAKRERRQCKRDGERRERWMKILEQFYHFLHVFDVIVMCVTLVITCHSMSAFFIIVFIVLVSDKIKINYKYVRHNENKKML